MVHEKLVNKLQVGRRSEEHTSELQSQSNLVCRLLLEKKNNPPQPLALRGRVRCVLPLGAPSRDRPRPPPAACRPPALTRPAPAPAPHALTLADPLGRHLTPAGGDGRAVRMQHAVQREAGGVRQTRDHDDVAADAQLADRTGGDLVGEPGRTEVVFFFFKEAAAPRALPSFPPRPSPD